MKVKTIKTLKLNDCKLCDTDMECVKSGLMKNKFITRLYLNNNYLSNAGVKAI